ncbi:MAG: EAL domain-containing protein, partial [Nitriliruptoraceae bacterium]
MTLAPSLRAIVRAALDEWHTGAGRTITEDDETYALADALAALASGSDTPSPLWLAYQPIVDLANSRMVATEALVRPGPALARLLPDAPAIVRTAERSGLIVPLGAWVMATALVDGATWRQATAPELQIHVNA